VVPREIVAQTGRSPDQVIRTVTGAFSERVFGMADARRRSPRLPPGGGDRRRGRRARGAGSVGGCSGIARRVEPGRDSAGCRTGASPPGRWWGRASTACRMCVAPGLLLRRQDNVRAVSGWRGIVIPVHRGPQRHRGSLHRGAAARVYRLFRWERCPEWFIGDRGYGPGRVKARAGSNPAFSAIAAARAPDPEHGVPAPRVRRSVRNFSKSAHWSSGPAVAGSAAAVAAARSSIRPAADRRAAPNGRVRTARRPALRGRDVS